MPDRTDRTTPRPHPTPTAGPMGRMEGIRSPPSAEPPSNVVSPTTPSPASPAAPGAAATGGGVDHQPLELGGGGGVAAEDQPGFEAVLPGEPVLLAQPARLGPGEGLAGEVGQRLAPPEPQRRGEGGIGAAGPP